MPRVMSSLLAGLGLIMLVSAGCPSPPVPTPAESPEVRAPITPTAGWTDALAGLGVTAPSPGWGLTPQEPSGGVASVQIVADADCTGHVWRTRISNKPVTDRAEALDARILDRLGSLGVRDVVVRDRGEVPHGDFRARMLRVAGVRAGQPWSGRITATFVTRSTGRFYVEIAATGSASTFVARRSCFDAITAACIIHEERR